jgi:hypothetical protein
VGALSQLPEIIFQGPQQLLAFINEPQKEQRQYICKPNSTPLLQFSVCGLVTWLLLAMTGHSLTKQQSKPSAAKLSDAMSP